MKAACCNNQSQIVQSESKGESWLKRNWRPMLMLMLMYAGRSLEKISENLAPILTNKNKK